ncbi:unnamed protein product [Adineta ricciae]|uniref:G-protein coupled receptors family 1 profile domain-containing protein n=1 Tax=Adineta ricciae TaxID=249248 RepID=A0A815DQH9_ADIRI|nr:unnamed protein product [Adineta ricciae]CAF1653521.1 unnamed protein product [Adineta ricciae]
MSTAAFLYYLHEYVFKYGGSTLIIVGTISCILNLMVFTRNNLRKNPCTIYLIAINIIDLSYIYSAFFLLILASGYNIDPTTYSTFFCRFRYYIGFILLVYEPSCLILASVDRTLITSRNAATRRHSTCRMAVINIIAVCVFWTIFHIHVWIGMQILQFGPNIFVCYFNPGAYETFISYYTLMIHGAVLPSLMLTFGFWTWKNLRRVRHATQSGRTTNTAVVTTGRPQILQTKDQQLIRMVLMEIMVYILCKYPIVIFHIYQEITEYNEKSPERQLIEQNLVILTIFTSSIENCISCYTNAIVSKTFRLELKRLLKNILQMFCCQRC